MKKIAIVSFKGEMPCFVHALLNVWNYPERGYETALIVEGASARLADIGASPRPSCGRRSRPLGWLNRSVRRAAQMGTLEEVKQGLLIDAALSVPI